jgi:hypothetical protein
MMVISEIHFRPLITHSTHMNHFPKDSQYESCAVDICGLKYATEYAFLRDVTLRTMDEKSNPFIAEHWHRTGYLQTYRISEHFQNLSRRALETGADHQFVHETVELSRALVHASSEIVEFIEFMLYDSCYYEETAASVYRNYNVYHYDHFAHDSNDGETHGMFVQFCTRPGVRPSGLCDVTKNRKLSVKIKSFAEQVVQLVDGYIDERDVDPCACYKKFALISVHVTFNFLLMTNGTASVRYS